MDVQTYSYICCANNWTSFVCTIVYPKVYEYVRTYFADRLIYKGCTLYCLYKRMYDVYKVMLNVQMYMKYSL